MTWRMNGRAVMNQCRRMDVGGVSCCNGVAGGGGGVVRGWDECAEEMTTHVLCSFKLGAFLFLGGGAARRP